MKTHYETPKLTGTVLAIGAFDGVHRGHQIVIREAVQRSKLYNVSSTVYTFDPPPRAYFQGKQILSPIKEKLRRLSLLEVDHTVIAPFNDEYLTRSASEFIREIALLNPVEILVGKDFHFGQNREGNVNLLSSYFKVKVIEPVCCSNGEMISSTRIRELVSLGKYKKAFTLLGWPVY
ncbi:FAD synthetase family protein [Bacillus sp. FJAT-45350]|uniref:FAD synthetase family protein n=1 Tax=Bacillus sp. FJAT-45350 TaxID=2011014 RepID=UPI000BB7AA87|nr:FAD synthetase family protein [Bacillus sp. FJAT-45350]